MKVYVDNVDVLDDLFDATSSYKCWACNRDDDLEIVSLAEYDEQVRKEVCEKLNNQNQDILELKKAFEMACRELNDCKKRHMPSYNFTAIDEMNAFKLLAKEMMKSE